jgi:hypothetical protein
VCVLKKLKTQNNNANAINNDEDDDNNRNNKTPVIISRTPEIGDWCCQMMK